MIWIKTLHIFFVISWFACLFYLPRLFVNHATQKSTEHHSLLLGMEARLIKMMNFTLIFVLITGLLFLYKVSASFSMVYFQKYWIWIKLALVQAWFFITFGAFISIRTFQKKPKLTLMFGLEFLMNYPFLFC